MDLGDLNKVWEVRPLKMPGEDEARRMLEKVAKQVQPIMRKRGWKVPILSEFRPDNPSLMGLNEGGGAHVKLRLRRPGRDWDFFPFEHVLDTMLHELSHIEHGPHNADFYRLWDEGINGTGKGFDLPGRRLGGFTRYPSPPPLRQAALVAAERRARGAPILPSGPRRLGGDGDIMTGLSPIQAAAMAAERRMHDDQWCTSRSSSYGESSVRQYGLKGEDDSNVITQGGGKRPDAAPLASLQSPGESASISMSASDEVWWECNVCSLLNKRLFLVCEACGNPKPKETASKFRIWSCKFCTLENNTKLDKCLACGQWRYSHGPPVSTGSTHFGT
ncbi:unnamed protein product [Spirodela intermedia]|uniref:Uncharacterized protein n=2 Tax=Spirodela intermedia TaxID=51605 RepID=A0A7I8IYT6_SPIIN|nr:unnamed protein product [Spirodela intermedia]CAA6662303.1 unnamed protein product [Spirodela intermedia]CAA7398701.1 unnamed protein product [Spirodela intermedia]